ncbi:MAG: hypothetical protein UU13_C0003G0018 [Candidatus Nomurabacteria bacterium GW2011_GWB1_40_7]|uniref:Tetratricopeptide repeat protein n=1 Tax=Candidatus Nomurabacteria bacterium GW2011_GWB1_40_7 TaxID=1618744 RepID=A0A0G0T0L5_9BACT|nr:MAG: hypothetical protein UU13_C0003G0018 [Candidatus Nomurabacteria bacterium GW2011_GWB1_40_7]
MLIIIPFIFAFGVYENNDYKINNEEATQETQNYSQQEMKEAIIYFNQSEEFDKALLLAKEYVSLYPEDTEGWVHRGYAYFNLGQCVEASADLYHGSVNGNKDASEFLAMVANSDMCKEATKP